MTNNVPTVRVIGHCDTPPDVIAARHKAGRVSELTRLLGEYVLCIDGDDETFLISSVYGVVNYYYAVVEGRLVHADTVLGVMQKGRLKWDWHWPAVANVAFLEHTLGEETVHPRVKRLAPASVLRFAGGRLTLSSTSWEELHPPVRPDPKAALSAFNAAVRKWADDASVVSMSGGFDSRVMLSSFLASDRKPPLLCMGKEATTDLVVSRDIAKAFNLQLQVVEVAPEDYLAHGRRIAELTGGTKTAANWHTYLYPLKAGLGQHQKLFVGSNGEFARTYYLDKGLAAVSLDRLAPRTMLKMFWKYKLKNIFQPDELPGLVGPLRAEFEPDGRAARVARVLGHCPGRMLDGLDRFYVGERVRGFIANGLKLLGATSQWRVPLLDREWVRQIWALPRHWKLGSNWHRYALRENAPHLLDFPEEGRSPTMPAKAPRLYWAVGRSRYPVVGYADYKRWFRDGPLSDHLRGQADRLSPVIDPAVVRRILDRHKETGTRARTLSFLFALLFWAEIGATEFRV